MDTQLLSYIAENTTVSAYNAASELEMILIAV